MKPELLAPAGGHEQLEYAIRFGADAVYLACEHFGMRQRAHNFELTELPNVVDYAHSHNVKVHVTCNIMMHAADMEQLPAFLRQVDEARADALIVGDLGALALAREHAPNVALHASTQASVCNARAARIWHELGASRIVCAREMSLSDIATMRSELPPELELEVFAHGSMCMAYSGRCLISDYLTGRSALSGHCTQPCRWSYTLEEKKRPGEHFPIEQDENGTYIMNAEDLNMLAHLDELSSAGVSSIKIEGRNKKAFYVATVVNAYRQVLDGAAVESFAKELETVSHRPYSTGFFFGPAHQATKSDAREQTRELAAIVLSAHMNADGMTEATVRCRNAFEKEMPIEVLSPRHPVREVPIEELWWLGPDEDELLEYPEATARANRTMELYRIVTPCELHVHDILRKVL